MSRRISAAVVQAAPIPLAISDGLVDLQSRAAAAITSGADVVAFGESFIGGYPLWFDHAPGAAMWSHPGAQALHRILLDQAIRGRDPRLDPLQQLVDASGALISFGAHERVRSSLYNTQYLLRPRLPAMLHRKLVPTHGERLLWGSGDGSTLEAHRAPWGVIGSLICWEHWMPLLRATMHHSEEAVHVAAWPSVNDAHLLASRSYAFEGRCFVLAAGTIQSRGDLLDGLARVGGNAAAQALLESIAEDVLQTGRSAIIAPDGTIAARAGNGDELLLVDLDLDQIGGQLCTLDSDGHYSRPDIFQLTIDRSARAGVTDLSASNDVERPAISIVAAPAINAG
jgi:predicted amidohydrolase